MNSKLDPDSCTACLDFASTIVCDLVRMKADGAISTVGTFFEEIFRYAEGRSDCDPTWGLSDAMGGRVASRALTRFVLSLLPKKLGKDVRRAAHFAVRDVSKET